MMPHMTLFPFLVLRAQCAQRSSINAPTDLARGKPRSFEAQFAQLERDALEDAIVTFALLLQLGVTLSDVLVDAHAKRIEDLLHRAPRLIATQPQNGL
jgi:hypothetical protein